MKKKPNPPKNFFFSLKTLSIIGFLFLFFLAFFTWYFSTPKLPNTPINPTKILDYKIIKRIELPEKSHAYTLYKLISTL